MNNNQLNSNQINIPNANIPSTNSQGTMNNQPTAPQPKQDKKSSFDLKKVILLVLLILLIVLFIYVIYLKVTDTHTNKPNDTDKDNIVDNNKYTIEDFNEYLDTLNILSNKTNLLELTNQEILQILLTEYLKDENHDTQSFKVEDLENIHKNSILSNLEVEYTSILDKLDLYGFSYNDDLYSYELSENTYNWAGTGGHGLNKISIPVYRELVLFNETDGRYTISQRIVFANSYGDGPNPYYIYYDSKQAVEDAKNNSSDENSFLKLDETNLSDYLEENTSISSQAVSKYIYANYADIKDKLSTYTYTFEEIDDHLVLTDFSVMSGAE